MAPKLPKGTTRDAHQSPNMSLGAPNAPRALQEGSKRLLSRLPAYPWIDLLQDGSRSSPKASKSAPALPPIRSALCECDSRLSADHEVR